MIISNPEKRNLLFIFLAGFFITNAVLAELIGVKIFSLEKTFGIEAFQIYLFDKTPLSFNFTAGVILWPFVFITTDLINEYFGQRGVKIISFLAIGFIAYAFIMLFFITQLQPSDYWLSLYQVTPTGEHFDINYAFNLIFTQGLAIILASLVAFLIGQFVDVLVFQKIKTYTGGKYIWLRATGSTVVSQFIDSFIVLGLAFYVFKEPEHRWSLSFLLSVGVVNYIYKLTVAILLTPLLYLAHYAIDKYIGEK
jgi:uncharacterized integral membrane protein (TIGR00697 family)